MEISPAEISPAEIYLAKIGRPEVGPAKVGHDIGVPSSPGVPGFDAFV
jgi:hypothetical protein